MAEGDSRFPPIEQLKGRPLGRVFMKMGRVTRAQVHEALQLQKQQKRPLGQVLRELGYVNEEDLQLALAFQIGMESTDLSKVDIDKSILALLPAQVCHTYHVVPVDYSKEANLLTIAVDTPDNFQATDDLKTLMGFNVKAVIVLSEQLNKALQRYYPEDASGSVTDILKEIEQDTDLSKFEGRGGSIDLDELREMIESNPVKKLLNLVLLQAIKDKASDIHFEPFEDEFKMRYRIDGVLYEMVPPPRHIAYAISSRIKVMANLDIAERRMPQDGRIPLVVAGSPVDLRVSVLPTMFGESVVLRVLDRTQVNLDMGKLGLREDDLRVVRQMMGKPHGIIVCTGPTGSGKTTTLYAALRELNTIDVKILTAEDPVEYDVDGMIQVQVNPDVGMTFARALRSFLRQDPDIILVGEVRDKETAIMAVQSALTGHLVFSTLHTNDAPSSIARLLDLGLEPFQVTAAVEAIVAQRLVRRICEHCKEEFEPTEEMLMELNLRPADVQGQRFFYGRGCDYCHSTGYRGRMGIYEVMPMDEEIRELIMKHASSNILRTEARKRGMRSLRESGLMAIYDGHTTIEEVVRETLVEEM
jgi:type IV pilus assembly protein PilB